jgi:hypothetical protein
LFSIFLSRNISHYLKQAATFCDQNNPLKARVKTSVLHAILSDTTTLEHTLIVPTCPHSATYESARLGRKRSFYLQIRKLSTIQLSEKGKIKFKCSDLIGLFRFLAAISNK